MEIEVTLLDPSEKEKVQPILREMRTKYLKSQKELKNAVRALNLEKDIKELTGPESEMDQNRLLVHDNLLRQNARLQEGIRIGREAEGCAAETLKVLNSNKDIIERAQLRTGEMSDNMRKSNTVLNRMTARNRQNLILILLVIFLLVCAVGMVAYIKFK